MVKYLFYLLILVLSTLMVLVLPKNWKKKTWQRFLIGLFVFCSIFSFYAMISITHLTYNAGIRKFLNYASLIFFMMNVSAIFVFILRYLMTYITIRLKAWNTVKILLKDGVYLASLILFTLFFLVVGSRHFSECKIETYDVNLTDGSVPDPSQCTIGLISDLHLGAGADNQMVVQMCEQLVSQKPDMICITGDLVDMTSFEEDVHFFAEQLSKVPTKYGIFYVEGNHEADSDLDCKEILEKYGIVCLYDEAVTLENGVVMVGRKDNVEVPVSEILQKASISEDQPTVILSHQPLDYENLKEHSYLMLSGHTHGFQIPMYGLLTPFMTDLSYGYRTFGNLKAITTSGVSAWGFRIKWPSYNEICMVKLVF